MNRHVQDSYEAAQEESSKRCRNTHDDGWEQTLGWGAAVGGREEWRAASRQMDIEPADLHLYPLGLPKAREG
jgi:hypothetical protein